MSVLRYFRQGHLLLENAGIVDQLGHSTQRTAHRIEHTEYLGFISHVCLHGHTAHTTRRQFLAQGVRRLCVIPVIDRDRVTLLCQQS